MRFWLSVGTEFPFETEPLERVVQFARDAERPGFEGVTLPEHLVVKVGDRMPHPTGFQLRPEAPFPDPFCVFSAMAAVPTRLRFLTFVCVIPLRNVFALTKQIATLAALSNDRVVLGGGVGWLRDEFETVGEGWSTRGRRMDEMLDIMRDFWDDGYAEHHGDFYEFPRSGMFPIPAQPVPIWLGGDSSRAAARAARFDGYMPMSGLNEQSRREFAEVTAYRVEHGLDGPYERIVSAPTDPNPDVLGRYEAEDGITAVTVAPTGIWGSAAGRPTYEQKLALAERYVDEVIANV